MIISFPILVDPLPSYTQYGILKVAFWTVLCCHLLYALIDSVWLGHMIYVGEKMSAIWPKDEKNKSVDLPEVFDSFWPKDENNQILETAELDKLPELLRLLYTFLDKTKPYIGIKDKPFWLGFVGLKVRRRNPEPPSFRIILH